MRVILVGIYPPPYGGVSIHLQRLLHRLVARQVSCVLLDLSKEPKVRPNVICQSWARAVWYLLFTKRSLVHFHNFSPRNTVVFFLVSLRHRTILSLHNERFLDELNARGRFVRTLGTFFLNRLDCVVVDSQKCWELAQHLVRDPRKLSLIPEYLDPITIPALANETIGRLRAEHRYLLGSNAFQISFHKGQDLYGIDLLIALMDRLVHGRNLDVAMAFLLPNIGDPVYFDWIQREVDRLGLARYLAFITEPMEEAVSLWRVCDLVIRATVTDGNSLTVMESLSVGTPVIASDCVDRPDGSVLFATRDLDDLERCVVDVLLHTEDYRQRLAALDPLDNGERFMALYESMGMSSTL